MPPHSGSPACGAAALLSAPAARRRLRRRLTITITITAAVTAASLSGCGYHSPRPATDAGSDGGTQGGEARTIPAGSSAQSINQSGTLRTFHLYRPATLPDAPPLVVMLHGGFGSGAQAERSYGWDSQADSAGFVVAYPDGLRKAWNTGGGCCGRPGTDNVDDVAFIKAMVTSIERQIPIDPRRIYATGISNGGIMAYTLACATTLFAAIGPDSATQLGDCPHPAPTSVIHIHGTADRFIPYGGGIGVGFGRIDGPSASALNATWRAIDHCGEPTQSTATPVTTSTATCPQGRTVELISIAGAGHQWPGGRSNPILEHVLGLDPPSTALEATATIWQFFAQHPSR